VLASVLQELLVEGVNRIAVLELTVTSDLPLEIFVSDAHLQKEAGLGVIADHQIYVVVDDRAPDSPRKYSSIVGERIKTVFGALNHGQG